MDEAHDIDDRAARVAAAQARYESSADYFGEAVRDLVASLTGTRMSVADAARYMRRRELEGGR